MTTTSKPFVTHAANEGKEKRNWRQHSIFICVFCLLLIGQKSLAVDFTVLTTFGAEPAKGYGPNSALFLDHDGNFYGTCYGAGVQQPGVIAEGTVFRMTSSGQVTTLATFYGTNGRNPSGVIRASDNNFYGTTKYDGPSGGGTVFQLTPGGTLTTIYRFATSGSKGSNPMTSLIQGKDGNLYGTTEEGGAGDGTNFRITTTGTLTTLRSLNATNFFTEDGVFPLGRLIQDKDGNLYGTTSTGGGDLDVSGAGTIFKLAPDGTYTILHTFTGGDTDGSEPWGGLTRGSDGNYYGTTTRGGSDDLGTVYKITPAGGFKLLHSFDGNDGNRPVGELAQGPDGNFYGVTEGSSGGSGNIFKITPQGALTAIHYFDSPSDGDSPQAGLTLGNDGNFYGMTFTGGPTITGTAFRLGTKSAPIGNISTRLEVGTGNNVLIGGFIISGNGPTKNIILRALGPTLTQFGVIGALNNPAIELHDGTGALVRANDNWATDPNAQSVINSGKAPPNPNESAMFVPLVPGSYTAVVHGVGGGTGVGLVEAYDVDGAAATQLSNISTRGFVQSGTGVMIAGLIVGGTGSKTMVIRGLGPTLAQFGVTNVLADPTLDVRDANGVRVMANDNWKNTQQSDIEASGLAPPNDLEAAVLVTLTPGKYTAVVSGVGNATGNALVEAYSVN